MAKQQGNPAGVYAPLTWRARRLIAQLRRATHRSVQNALIQELVYEMQKRKRRVRKKAGGVKKYAGAAAKKAAGRARQGAGSVWHRIWYGPKLHCSGCGRDFHNRLQFAAHARAHQRTARTAPARQPAGRQKGRTPTRATEHQRAQRHAADHLAAARPEDRQKVRETMGAAKARQAANERADRSAFAAAEGFKRAEDLERRGLAADAGKARAGAQAKQADAEKYRGKYLYEAGGKVIGSDKPLTARQLDGVSKQMADARKMQAAGRVQPGDTVKTHVVNGRQASRTVEGPDGKAKAPAARTARPKPPSAGRSRTAPASPNGSSS